MVGTIITLEKPKSPAYLVKLKINCSNQFLLDRFMMYYSHIFIVVLILCENHGIEGKSPKLDPGRHVATDHKMVIRSADGHEIL